VIDLKMDGENMKLYIGYIIGTNWERKVHLVGLY